MRYESPARRLMTSGRNSEGRRQPGWHAVTRPWAVVAALVTISAPSATKAAEADAVPAHLQTCVSCHGPQGRSSAAEIPHLAGQQQRYLVKQLEAFRAGERKNELMQAIAGQLTPQDIQALALYWSRLPPDGGTTHPGATPVPSGMSFPQGFPVGFVEYDRESDEKMRIVTVRYVNQVGADAVRAGKPLPSGAVILSGSYAVLVGADGRPELDAQGRWKLGPLRSVAGMESREGWGDQVPQLLRNGDWHYGLWTPDGQSRLRDMHAQCLACHQPKAAQSYVFTWDALHKSLSDSR